MSAVIPIQYTQLRFRCPFCRRTYARGKAAIAHAERCFNNPDRKTCRTCRHAAGPDGMTLAASGGFAASRECAVDAGLDHCCPTCGAEVLPAPGYCTNGCTAQPVSGLRVLCPSWTAALP